jgi:hypothetical protein
VTTKVKVKKTSNKGVKTTAGKYVKGKDGKFHFVAESKKKKGKKKKGATLLVGF